MSLPHSDKEVSEILQSLGFSSLEDLFSHIDPSYTLRVVVPTTE